jgi:hypothetical protein
LAAGFAGVGLLGQIEHGQVGAALVVNVASAELTVAPVPSVLWTL